MFNENVYLNVWDSFRVQFRIMVFISFLSQNKVFGSANGGDAGVAGGSDAFYNPVVLSDVREGEGGEGSYL
jgi:hypothetical protein